MAEIEEKDLQQQFASDNYAGICPEAWQAMEAANRGHVTSYGDDPWTARAADAFRSLFETQCEVYFVFNGTAANSLALASLCQSYHSVICSDQSHVETDECGAPEFFSNGSKLLAAASDTGKLTPEAIHELATKRHDIHYPKPRAVTLTQSTETGRVYTLKELGAIAEECRGRGLSLHMDGARFANACASLGCSPAEMSWKSGVDVLCFGGTKNGMAIGEAVLFFNREQATDFDYRCKQAGQLASKMRFLSAPWVGMLESGAWLRNAETCQPVRAAVCFADWRDSQCEDLAARGGKRGVCRGAGGSSESAPRTRMEFLYLHRRRGALHVRVGHRSQAGGCAEQRLARVRGCRAARVKQAPARGAAIDERKMSPLR